MVGGSLDMTRFPSASATPGLRQSSTQGFRELAADANKAPMRTSVALRVASGLVFLAQFASAETPASAPPQPSAAPAPGTAPAPAPASAEPGAAAADPTATEDAGPVVVPADNQQPPLEPIPSAHDTLGGHFVVGASVGAKWQYGSIDQGMKLNDYLGAALALNLDVGYGVSRNVVLGVWGNFDDHSKPNGCPLDLCTGGKSFAGGPFIRYHLVQGTRFDPWGMFSLGVRSTTVDSKIGSKDYFGVDILKLTVGGDWYPTSNVGFGPYFTFDWGTYGSDGGHTGISTGVRLVLDLPGK